MGCSGAFTDSPFFWAVLSGAFLGMAVSRSTMRTLSKPDPEGARNWKWIFLSLYLSAAILSALGGAFLTGPERVVDIRLLVVLGVTALVFALAFRFKRAFGIACLGLVFLGTAYFLVALDGHVCYPPGSEILRFRVISTSTEETRIEILHPDATSEFITVDGRQVALGLERLTASEVYFFAARPAYYRMLGFAPDPSLESGSRLSRSLRRLPGWEYSRMITAAVVVQELWTYAAILESGDRVGIIRASP